MRHYLYIWHAPAERMIVASGIEFKDVMHALLDADGIVLRKGGAGTARKPAAWQTLTQQQLPALAREDLYACGSHAWADYRGAPPASGDADVAAMLGHRGPPGPLPALRGRFLTFAHDDGWYLKLLYAAWDDAAALLARAIAPALGKLDMDALQQGGDGYWLQDGMVDLELATHDIDSVLNRRL
ncbi:hypothetical protein IGS61_01675 [Janthinobacterium sp. FW305-129]|uniref:hypothetical protein n=1 Tax=Janthinobacterium sp. FW305-129 TaxID=2775054 RepID=UPI001E5A7286|nr:hypothetical protein [Janthinobacterium sp. FW305-129]MCC7596177.1 hypothetical protein [Janthinobacterium sp. FW305-129]